MKKTIFVGISLLSISICIDEVWGDLPRRYNTSNIGRRTSWQGSTVSNSQNRRNNIGNMNVQAMTNVGPESVKSFLAGILIGRSASDDLKKIVDEVPSEDIRVLQRNMENFNIFLKGSGDEDAKNVANKLERAIACLGELITVKDVICSELQYQTKENKGSSNGMVSLSGINDDLNEVNMKRLSEIILICEKERTFAAFTGALKKFSNRINNLKNILKEMSDTFNPVVLGQIEGNPGLQNLESANTPENRRLGKIRDDEEEKNDSFDSQIVSAQQNTGQQSGTENNTNNATNSQPTPAQQSVGQSATESIPANAAVVQVASTPQNTIQTTDISNSDATTTPGVSGQPQNTTQIETGNSSNNATSQGVLTQQQSVGQTGTENNTNNATNSQPTPAQQGVGQSATESIPANAAVAQVSSTPQNTIQTTDVSNSNATTTPGVSGQPQNTGQTGTENNTNNATNSQPTPAQQGVGQPVTENNTSNVSAQADPVQSEQSQNTESIQILPGKLVEEPEDIGKSSFENGSGYDSGYESENNTTTASNSLVNTINREDPKEFYALLEQNVGLLKEEDLEGKKKIAYDKVRGYLENAKSERSFAERVTDVKNIIDAYNSLATLIPRTKKWERLRTVPRQKIKSLRETIYSDVFDDLKSRMEKLKADDELKNYGKDIDSFIKLNERNKSDFFDNSFFNEFLKYIENNKKELNFADFLRTKGKNTESFEAITSDRKNKVGRSDQFSNALIYDDKKASFVIGIYRRGLMSASMDSYDKLIMKFWKETKVDRKVVDLVGPDLRNRVLFSIDVN